MLQLLNEQRLQREAAEAWITGYPRRMFGSYGGQVTVQNEDQLIETLEELRGETSGFVSVYGFPRGHSTNGNIPKVNTIMYDLDIPDSKDVNTVAEWETSISQLLERVRTLAEYLVDEGFADHWRASLSGNKGIHLYQDIPEINPRVGSQKQFKNGLADYTSALIEHFGEVTGYDIDKWVDVDSSDLGRLTRMPNTKHVGACERFGEDRYCVPVSVRELTELDVSGYVELTSGPRSLPASCHRNPNPKAGRIIEKHIRTASTGGTSISGSTSVGRSLEEYKDDVNENIEELRDVEFILKNKPCLWAFRERDDAFDHGQAPHTFELFVLTEFITNHVPVDIMIEYFADMDGFEETVTRERIAEVIEWCRGQGFNCETIWSDAPQFCLKEECNIYNHKP